LDDNAGLYHALKTKKNVQPIFIFDKNILDRLDNKSDARVLFIHDELSKLKIELEIKFNSSLLCLYGHPSEIWERLCLEQNIDSVFTNHDFEPYANERDEQVKSILNNNGSSFHTFKDHVIFEKNEIVKDDGLPYTVFTPYAKKWKAKLNEFYKRSYPTLEYAENFIKTKPLEIPTLESMGFKRSDTLFPEKIVKAHTIQSYLKNRDIPSIVGTSRLGLHLRFGTLSIRKLLSFAITKNETFVNELIWRDFYQQILFHFPHVVNGAFKKQYDNIKWDNNEIHFKAWCEGKTGYPLVDAGMRELNATGYMHNRVRMVTASFLTKHLLIDWKWGETYFAEKLLDFDLAANNGGWQWAAGSGTDAAPYFRIFNPTAQQKKFDAKFEYIKKWILEFGTDEYYKPIVIHEEARARCLNRYKEALENK
jgi:deoxyribodipyrimidine photo-lyase